MKLAAEMEQKECTFSPRLTPRARLARSRSARELSIGDAVLRQAKQVWRVGELNTDGTAVPALSGYFWRTEHTSFHSVGASVRIRVAKLRTLAALNINTHSQFNILSKSLKSMGLQMKQFSCCRRGGDTCVDVDGLLRVLGTRILECLII